MKLQKFMLEFQLDVVRTIAQRRKTLRGVAQLRRMSDAQLSDVSLEREKIVSTCGGCGTRRDKASPGALQSIIYILSMFNWNYGHL
jgi:hypothetical protein